LSYQSGTISSDEWTRIAAVKADSRAEGANIDTEREKKGIHPRITTKKEYATHLDADEVFVLRHTTTDAPRYRERDYILTERDELLMCLLGEHGLRVGEVAALDARNINVRRKKITVKRPKSHRQDTLSLMPATLRAAEKYLPFVDQAGPLFYGYGGRRITRQGIYKRVRNQGSAAPNRRAACSDCPSTDLGNDGSIVRRQLKIRADGLCPLEKQVDRWNVCTLH